MLVESIGMHVVGRHGLHFDPGDLDRVAGRDRHDVPREIPGHVVRSDELGPRPAEPLDLLRLEVVGVGVRDEDDVGRRVLTGRPPWIDVDRESVAGEPHGRLPEPREPLEHDLLPLRSAGASL
jgi:hypothetical protein